MYVRNTQNITLLQAMAVNIINTTIALGFMQAPAQER